MNKLEELTNLYLQEKTIEQVEISIKQCFDDSDLLLQNNDELVKLSILILIYFKIKKENFGKIKRKMIRKMMRMVEHDKRNAIHKK